jgi:hypothetical protein
MKHCNVVLLVYFCFCCFVLWGLLSKKSLPRLMSWSFSLCFLLEALQFGVLYSNLYCTVSWLCAWFNFTLCMWISSFPNTIYLEILFPHRVYLVPCWKSVGLTHTGLFLTSLVCFIDLYDCLNHYLLSFFLIVPFLSWLFNS